MVAVLIERRRSILFNHYAVMKENTFVATEVIVDKLNCSNPLKSASSIYLKWRRMQQDNLYCFKIVKIRLKLIELWLVLGLTPSRWPVHVAIFHFVPDSGKYSQHNTNANSSILPKRNKTECKIRGDNFTGILGSSSILQIVGTSFDSVTFFAPYLEKR